VVGGLNFTKEAFKYSDKKIIFKTKTKDGRKIKRGKVVATIYGKPKAILKSERVALNFLSFISGVATITRKFVNKIKGKSCKICCTRKTAPNLRLIQKYGVRLGGGINHRFNLSDEILIKDNHISVDGNIKELVKRAVKNKKGKKITVEIDNLNQLKKILGLKFNRVLFDNMSEKNLKKGIKLVKNRYETEASGGVSLKNVRKVASSGVKRISVGQITHSAPSINFSLEI
jgi:nicotinate-nucleotide pyrophosphorylase